MLVDRYIPGNYYHNCKRGMRENREIIPRTIVSRISNSSDENK